MARAKRKIRERKRNYLKQKSAKKRKEKKSGRYKRPPDTKVVKLPQSFSLINQPNKLIEFLGKLREIINKRPYRIKLDSYKQKECTHDAIIFLLSKLKDPVFFRSIEISGIYPAKDTAKKIWEETEFPKFVSNQNSQNKSINTLTKAEKTAYFHETQVRTDLIAHSLEKSNSELGTVIRENKIESYDLASEICSNSVEHGRGKSSNKNLYYLFSSIPIKNKDSVKCIIVDNGVGIFRSIELDNRKKHKVMKWGNKFNFDNVEHRFNLLKGLISGDIVVSENQRKYSGRGNGLRMLGELSENDKIHELYLISDNIFYKVKENSIFALKTSIEGTVVHWEYKL